MSPELSLESRVSGIEIMAEKKSQKSVGRATPRTGKKRGKKCAVFEVKTIHSQKLLILLHVANPNTRHKIFIENMLCIMMCDLFIYLPMYLFI